MAQSILKGIVRFVSYWGNVLDGDNPGGYPCKPKSRIADAYHRRLMSEEEFTCAVHGGTWASYVRPLVSFWSVTRKMSVPFTPIVAPGGIGM